MNPEMMKADHIPEVLNIHKKYYESEFNIFSEFLQDRDILQSYVVLDSYGKVVVAGGVRRQLELVAVTDKGRHPSDRKEALQKFLTASKFVGSELGYQHLHAFVQDEQWKNRLLRSGFIKCVGEPLVVRI